MHLGFLLIILSLLMAPLKSVGGPGVCSQLDIQTFYQAHSRKLVVKGPIGNLTPSTRAFAGSQPGLWVKDAAGDYWLLKQDNVYRELQTSAEVITAGLYRYLGYNATETAIVNYNGQRYVAVRSLGKKVDEIDLAASAPTDKYFKYLRIFAALTKDWDRLRQGPNNAVSNEKSGYVMYDFGGSLGARAQGKHKPGEVVSDAIGGFENIDDGRSIIGKLRVGWLPDNHPWRIPLSSTEYRDIARKLSYLTDDAIDALVDSAHYSIRADSEYMKKALKNRRDGLIEWAIDKGGLEGNPVIQGGGSSNKYGSIAEFQKLIKNTARDYSRNELKNIFGNRPVSTSQISTIRNYLSIDLWQYLPAYMLGFDSYRNADGSIVPFDQSLKRTAAEHLDNLRNVMEKNSMLPVGMKLYRGKRTSRPVFPMEQLDTAYMQTFSATSIDRHVAVDFVIKGPTTHSGNLNRILTEMVIVDEGIKGIFIPQAFLNANRSIPPLADRENELILQDKVNLVGLGHRVENIGGYQVIVEAVAVTK